MNKVLESDDDKEIVINIARPRKPKVHKTCRDYFGGVG